jgi:hypothetical protein
MPKALALLVLAVWLQGCSPQSLAAASDDTVELLPSRAPDADYLVLFLNRQTLLYNGDLFADRLHVAASRLKSVGCREPRLLREQPQPQGGTWAFGRPRIVYYSEWKCG